MPDTTDAVALVVGLGNPGDRYAGTRHNAGFWFVDEMLASGGDSLRPQSRFEGEHGRCRIGDANLHVLKPSTYMNESGRSVVACASYFDIDPGRILVVHDELDLAPGLVRLKRGGGHGGHNGLKDLVRHIGPEFARLRIGIGHPGSAEQVTPWVLGRPSREDEAAIRSALAEALAELPAIVRGEFNAAMTTLNRRAG